MKKKLKYKCDDLSKQEIYTITKRLYYLLRHHSDTIEFKKLYHGLRGLYDPETKEIIIDYRHSILPTLIHESLHRWHDDWPETRVYKEESRIMKVLTPRQIRNIIKILAEGF